MGTVAAGSLTGGLAPCGRLGLLVAAWRLVCVAWWHSSSGQRSWPVPRRAGDLAARSLQSQSDLYSRSRSRGEIATVSARSRAASALINSRHRLAHRLRHRHTGARGDTGRGCRRGPRRRDGRRRRRLNGARRVLDETHSFFMRRLSADYLGVVLHMSEGAMSYKTKAHSSVPWPLCSCR